GSSRGQSQQSAAAGGGGPGRPRAIDHHQSDGSAPAHAVRTSPGPGRAVGHARLHLTPPTPASPSHSTGNANGLAHRSSSSNGAGSPTNGRPSTRGSGPPAAHAPPGQTKPHTQTPPGQTKPHTQSPPGQTKPQTQPQPGQT